MFLMRASETASLATIAIGSAALKRQRAAMRALGANRVTSRPVLGSFDLVITADLPDDAAALAAMYALNANGFFVDCLRALEPADLDVASKRLDALLPLVRSSAPRNRQPSARQRPNQ